MLPTGSGGMTKQLESMLCRLFYSVASIIVPLQHRWLSASTLYNGAK
jgi:hypothetical protein